MSDDIDAIADAGRSDLTPPPPPPPPPPVRAPRRGIIGRKGAAVAVASGLVVGGVAGGYVISQAASSTPSASASPSTGSGTSTVPREHSGFAGGSPASRTQDLQQVATAIGITTTQLQTETSAGKTIATIAKEHNVDPATVISSLAVDENTEIDAAVTAGTLTSTQAAQMKAQTTQRVTDMVNGTEPAHGPGGPGGVQGEDQQVIATAIGITTTQLQTEVAAGKTVAAIASEHNVATASVVSALVSSENSEIDKRVASGEITAAQGTQEKTQTQQRVTDEVNGLHPAGGPDGRGGESPDAPAGSSTTN